MEAKLETAALDILGGEEKPQEDEEKPQEDEPEAKEEPKE